MKKPKYNKNSVIRGALRRAFARSPLVIEKMQQSRREVPRYNKDGSRHKKNWVQRQCEVCKEWVSTSKMSVDHIDPVVSVEDGFQDWNQFIDRLWCDISNLQRICDDCHDKKTASERVARLLKQYHEELDTLEHHIDLIIKKLSSDKTHYSAEHIKQLNKTLSKYTAKKKTIGLQSVVERAQVLKDRLKTRR